jgi:penicillin-binding protein 1B
MMQTWSRLDLSDMPPGRRRAVIAALCACCLLFLSGLVTAGYLWKLARQFPRAPFKQPSRLYAQPTVLEPGAPLAAGEIVAQLNDEGYREAPAGLPLRRGTYRRSGDHVEVHLRHFVTPEGPGGGEPLEIDLRGGRVVRLTLAGRPAKSAVLEPALLASFYGPDVDERRPVTLDSLPEPTVKAILAAEDDGFYVHPGISPTGIVRALWVNFRGGTVQQGGSTITQQLVKNIYLSRERTLQRKAKEALIAVALELRYGKRQILEAYLNEIYWGRSGPANLIGLGAASRAYFGKDADELTLPEAATLAGMIRGPSEYSPLEHPEKTIERRNWVLQRMGELGWIKPEQAQAAQAEPLITEAQAVTARPLAPYFTKAAAAEAKERFDIDDLADEGYLLFSTVGWREQRQAESAVVRELASLDKGQAKRRRGDDPLQAALISVDPRDGAIRAWVGGRDYSNSQFDRVSQAKRQAGSAFKPVVYAAAFREAVATPATLLKDSPIVVRVGNDRWQPQNNDRGFRGWVTVRSALEQSLNIPTIRLALQVGLGRIIDLAHDMGIESDLTARPSLALGAFEVSPYEMAQVYATLADGGLRPTLHGLKAVLERSGEEVLSDDLPSPRRVLPPQTAYLVTSILEGVVDHGTGAGVRAQGLSDPLAGKTGTTNDRRDNWFAGYAPDRVTVVWVGYDDNSRTRLSGARAALPIWSRFMAAVRPAAGYAAFAPPEGMQTVVLDPTTGQLATPYCPYKVAETLPEWQVPTEPCQRHQPGSTDNWAGVNLNGGPIDPATGQPLNGAGWDPYGMESDAREIALDDTGETAEAANEADTEGLPGVEPDAAAVPSVRITYPPARTFPPRPVTVDPADSTAATTSQDGSIMIRPSRRNPEPPPEEAPIGMTPPAATQEAEPAPPPEAETAEPAETESTPPAPSPPPTLDEPRTNTD